MRPVHVLGLVLLGVAALSIALVGLLGGRGDEGAGLTPAAQVPGAGPKASPPSGLRITDGAGASDEDEAARTEEVASAVLEGDEAASAGGFTNRLTGRVTGPDGVPVPGARLRLVPDALPAHVQTIRRAIGGAEVDAERTRFATSDEGGNYAFHSLPPSNAYALTARHTAYAERTKSDIQIRASGEHVVDLELDAGLLLHGHVRDALSGDPIANANVSVLTQLEADLPGFAGAGSGPRARTNGEGKYVFANIGAGTWAVRVSASGYEVQTRRELLFEEGVSPGPLDFGLARGRSIAGRAVDSNGMGIEGVDLEAMHSDGKTSSRGRAKSDANGYFEITGLAEASYHVFARHPQHLDESFPRVPAGTTEMLVTLTTLGGVAGQVINGDSGRPVRAFRIAVRQWDAGARRLGRVAAGGRFRDVEDGSFEVGGLESGSYVVEAHTGGFAPTLSEPFSVSSGLVTPDVVVRMSHGGRITGRIVDAATREPVVGATVRTYDDGHVENPLTQMLEGLGQSGRATAKRETKTDADGVFVLANLNAETYQLRISHDDYSQLVLRGRNVLDGAVDDLGTLALHRGATVRGTVYDSAGQPLAGAEVTLTRKAEGYVEPISGRTGDDGRFLLERVEAGTYTLHATRPLNAGSPFDGIVDMKKSEREVTVTEGGQFAFDLYLGGV